jgi:hypothetical protein
MSYQQKINRLFADINKKGAVYPTYPSYHKGPYLEEMFVEHGEKCGDRYLIPVFWTNAYKEQKQAIIQQKLHLLDPSKKYYCVCTHDDAPTESLPPDTLVFGAGGNNLATIPVPLVVSEVPQYEEKEKDITASFIGSYTHPIRAQMAQCCPPEVHGYALSMQPHWSEKITEERFRAFEDISIRSKYMLCPRGYGPTSYRLYEAFQYKAVPVYISDRFWLPWEDEVRWDDLIVKITPDQIPEIKSILENYDDKRETMIEYASNIYEDYFSIEGAFNKILDKLR